MKLLKVIGVSFLLFVLTGMIVMSLFTEKNPIKTAEAKYTQAVAEVDTAKVILNQKEYNACLAERDLGKEKLIEALAGNLEATQEEKTTWLEKSNWDCAF